MNTLIETSKSLTEAERLSLVMGILATLQAPKPTESKSKKEPKAKKDPKVTPADAPKKEANWFIQALSQVRLSLKPLIEAHNASLPEGGKKLAGTVATQVGSMLKEAGQLSATITPTDAQVKAAFTSFIASPPAPKSASVASDSSNKSKPSKPKAELTEEEASAKRIQKATKAAATREANKAKKAAAIVEPFTDMPSAEEESIETYNWPGDVGNGANIYERIDYNGSSYIYTEDGSDFVGEWNDVTKVLNPNVYNIKKQ